MGVRFEVSLLVLCALAYHLYRLIVLHWLIDDTVEQIVSPAPQMFKDHILMSSAPLLSY